MKTFLDMGGYAAYVWPAYAITLVAILANVAWARRALQAARQRAQRRVAAAAGRNP